MLQRATKEKLMCTGFTLQRYIGLADISTLRRSLVLHVVCPLRGSSAEVAGSDGGKAGRLRRLLLLSLSRCLVNPLGSMQLFVYAMFFGCLGLCMVLILFQFVIWPRVDRHRRTVTQVEAAAQLQAQAQIHESKLQEAFARLPVVLASELDERTDDCTICMTGSQEDRAWVILPCAHRELPQPTSDLGPHSCRRFAHLAVDRCDAGFHKECFQRWIDSAGAMHGACVVCQQPIVAVEPAHAAAAGLAETAPQRFACLTTPAVDATAGNAERVASSLAAGGRENGAADGASGAQPAVRVAEMGPI